MTSLLNNSRPPVFCPGCSHERVLHALDQALVAAGLAGEDVAIVTDIGCSGLFDVFFNTHAFHGLHGRALTYAMGIKMARPELKVIVTMGDGGLGIGGAHVLSTCRKNIDLTLLVLNNFNYGMTGGQCSSTTPQDASVGSGFLNRLEKPVDICRVAGEAGAAMVMRASTYEKGLAAKLRSAIAFEGFSLVDIHGICPGRYTKANKLSPKDIESNLAALPSLEGYAEANARKEYGQAYREESAKLSPVPPPMRIEADFKAPQKGRREIVILGSAGQRIVTAGEILCLAAATAGCHATQKNDYPITVMRGHSVSEVIMDDRKIAYTGIERPSVVIVLAQEGVARRKTLLAGLSPETLVIKPRGLEVPDSAAVVHESDFGSLKIKPQDWALASLAILAGWERVISTDMLKAALNLRFKGKTLDAVMKIVGTV